MVGTSSTSKPHSYYIPLNPVCSDNPLSHPIDLSIGKNRLVVPFTVYFYETTANDDEIDYEMYSKRISEASLFFPNHPP